MKRFYLFLMSALLIGASGMLISCSSTTSSGSEQKVTYNGIDYNVTGRYYDEDDVSTRVEVNFGNQAVNMKFSIDNSLLGKKVQLTTGVTAWSLKLFAGSDYAPSNQDLAGFTGWFKIVKNSASNYSVEFELATSSDGGKNLKGDADGAFSYDPRPEQKVYYNGAEHEVTTRIYDQASQITLVRLGLDGSSFVSFEINNSLLGLRVPLVRGKTLWAMRFSIDNQYEINNDDLAGFTGWFRVIENSTANYTIFFEIATPFHEGINMKGSVGGAFVPPTRH